MATVKKIVCQGTHERLLRGGSCLGNRQLWRLELGNWAFSPAELTPTFLQAGTLLTSGHWDWSFWSTMEEVLISTYSLCFKQT